MNITITSDHGGFELKQRLVEYYEQKGLKICSIGASSTASCDYSDNANELANLVLLGKTELGIAICGTGIGISIGLNRHKGIRAALLYDDFCAQMAKEHNNANVIVFGARTMTFEEVIKRIDIFMQSKFEGGRHTARIEKLDMGE